MRSVGAWVAGAFRPTVGDDPDFRFGRRDLVFVWSRLRMAVAAFTVLAGLVLGILWGAVTLFVIAALALVVVLDAGRQMRRHAERAFGPLIFDVTVSAIGVALLQVPCAAVAALLLYSAVSAKMLLNWPRTVLIWAYDALLFVLFIMSASLLSPPFHGARAAAAGALAAAIYVVGLLGLVAVLEGEVRRYHRSRRMELEAQLHAKDAFLATVSHELRTPLTSVVGFGALLEETWGDALPAEAGEMLALLNQQAGEVSMLVENLLVEARLDAGLVAVCVDEVDLSAAVAEVVRSLARLHPDKQIQVEGEAGVWVAADPARLREVIRNLLTNALHHGGDRVTLEIGRIEGGAVLMVGDDGPGLSTELHARTFQPFAASQPSDGEPDSLGLGLWLSRRLTRLMGGDLEYRRSDGHTIFTVSLPRVVTDSESQAPSDGASPLPVPADVGTGPPPDAEQRLLCPMKS